METYSGTQAMETISVDPVAEWAAPGGETGLEEPMWQLGLGGGPESYPSRPDEPDCIHYLRTGFCGYGNRCRFNHPPDRSSAMGSLRTSGDDYPERIGQPVCQVSNASYIKLNAEPIEVLDISLDYLISIFSGLDEDQRSFTQILSKLHYDDFVAKGDFNESSRTPKPYYMRTGMCKFGASCKYHHPKYGVASSAPFTLNFYGYPLRPGEKECSHYIKTGQCKFGLTCKFDHPQPAGIPDPPAVPTPAVYETVQSPSLQSAQQYGVIPGNWPVARPAVLSGSYLPGSYGPMIFPPGLFPVPGWTPYPAPVSPVASTIAQPTVGAGPIYGITQLSPSSTAYSSSSHKEHAFPERPGQPECQFYLRTGDCKFGSTCKYHHPRESTAPKIKFSLSPMGLPLRPGAPLCFHYAQSRVCRYGPSCRFDHPMGTLSYSPSASTLTDMPVAPYPVGSTNTTSSPSSSSSNLRPDLLAGPSRGTSSSHLSSTNSSSTSVGSTFSKSGPAPQSSVQHSGPGSAPSS